MYTSDKELLVYVKNYPDDREVKYPEKETKYKVNLVSGKLRCECRESIFEGCPCRHEICAMEKNTMKITTLNFNKRWTYDYFDNKTLPDIVKLH
jgi:hypothetical protein